MNKTSLTRCPHCDHPLMLTARPPIHPSTQNGWRQVPLMQSTTGSQPAITAGDWEKITPIGRLEPRDVTTAIYDAGVVSIMMATLSGVGIIMVNIYVENYHIDWWWSPITGLLAFCWRYLGGINLAKNLLEIIESITNQIIPDQPAEPPAPPSEEIHLDIVHRDEQGRKIAHKRPTLPKGITASLFGLWCDQVSQGFKSIGETDWVGKGNPFNKTAYRELLHLMNQQGIIRKDGTAPNSPWVLTTAGRPALRHWAEQTKKRALGRQTDGQTDQNDLNQGHFAFTDD